MKETSAARDEGGPAVCKAVAGGGGDVDGKGRACARRRRRLELRRLGWAAEGSPVPAKRIRSGSDKSLSSDSSLETTAAGCWPSRLSHGAVSVIGRRREMEDAFAVALSFLASDPSSAGAKDGTEGGQEQDFFAVYDGHGSARVAEACRERMHVVLAEEVGLRRGVGSDLPWEEAMAASFARVDGEVTGGFAPPPKPPPQQAAADDDAGAGNLPYRTVGSTAVVAVVGQRRIVVANCGDSRAVLSRGGVAVPLSTDHKPDRPDEMQRVEAAGGRVINWNGYRVLGVLATSRSIGKNTFHFPGTRCRCSMQPAVSRSILCLGAYFRRLLPKALRERGARGDGGGPDGAGRVPHTGKRRAVGRGLQRGGVQDRQELPQRAGGLQVPRVRHRLHRRGHCRAAHGAGHVPRQQGQHQRRRGRAAAAQDEPWRPSRWSSLLRLN
ncbi:protein phosphatase 2C 51-like isoform X1 [Miscanthus floridulus]|uniref:protein phosphatase 2C 51-like isoform X1 n=1 Tax=Miscanthus floridulus TaxID=154761 RepID=UPI00345998B1